MADNDQNDEYKFDDLDSFNDSLESSDDNEDKPQPSKPEFNPLQKDVRRNALVAVGAIVLLIIMYKLIFSGKSSKSTIPPPAPIAQPQPAPAATEIAPQPIQQPQPVVQDNALKQQVESIASTQQAMQSQINSMNEQIVNVTNNINNLTTQVNKLSQTVADLANQLSRQSEEINVLMERTRPKFIKHKHNRQMRAATIYYINAVIPGRAWLIGTNGSTLTVREGTKIAGYGIVKLIDSVEGRILTSSGRVIKFSQDDS